MTCLRCQQPAGWRRKYCIPCYPERERERRRELYAQQHPRICEECGVNPRPYKATFCPACVLIRDKRSHKRTRQEVMARYLAGRGGDVRVAYLERTRERRLAQMRAYYQRHKPPTPVRQCQFELCTNTFPASRGDRRKFCVDCVRVVYGRKKAAERAA